MLVNKEIKKNAQMLALFWGVRDGVYNFMNKQVAKIVNISKQIMRL